MKTETDTQFNPFNPHYKITPDDRMKAREAFDELLNASDDDNHAITAVLTVQSLLMHRNKFVEDTIQAMEAAYKVRAAKGGRHGR